MEENKVSEEELVESMKEAEKEDARQGKLDKRDNDKQSERNQRSSSVVPSNTNSNKMTVDQFVKLGLIIAGPTTGKTWLVNKLNSMGIKVVDGDVLMREADPRWSSYSSRLKLTKEEVEAFNEAYDLKVSEALKNEQLVITSKRPTKRALEAHPLLFPDCKYPLIVQRNDPSVVEAIMIGDRNDKSLPLGETERWHAHNIKDSNSDIANSYVWIAKGENLSTLLSDLEV